MSESDSRLELVVMSSGNRNPWFTTQDVPSDRRVHRQLLRQTRYLHHLLLSGIEYRNFLSWDRAPGGVDIREQYPLDGEKTNGET